MFTLPHLPCGQRALSAAFDVGLGQVLALTSGLGVDITGAIALHVLTNLAWSL